jgi:hypothetical protein
MVLKFLLEVLIKKKLNEIKILITKQIIIIARK